MKQLLICLTMLHIFASSDDLNWEKCLSGFQDCLAVGQHQMERNHHKLTNQMTATQLILIRQYKIVIPHAICKVCFFKLFGFFVDLDIHTYILIHNLNQQSITK